MIRPLFWILVVLTLAYFTTDLKFRDRTIQSHIDSFFLGEGGGSLRNKAMSRINHWLDVGGSDEAPEEDKALHQGDDIEARDQQKFKKIIEEN